MRLRAGRTRRPGRHRRERRRPKRILRDGGESSGFWAKGEARALARANRLRPVRCGGRRIGAAERRRVWLRKELGWVRRGQGGGLRWPVRRPHGRTPCCFDPPIQGSVATGRVSRFPAEPGHTPMRSPRPDGRSRPRRPACRALVQPARFPRRLTKQKNTLRPIRCAACRFVGPVARQGKPGRRAGPPHIWRSTIIFLISAMAFAGFRLFGQAWAQFMMVWQR